MLLKLHLIDKNFKDKKKGFIFLLAKLISIIELLSKNYSDLKVFQYLVQNSRIASSVTRDSNILFWDLYKCGGGQDYSKKGNMVGEKIKKLARLNQFV